MRRIDKQNVKATTVHKTNMRTCTEWPLAEHFPPRLDKKPKLSTKIEEPNEIDFIRMLTFHRLQNSPRQKNYRCKRPASLEGHQNVPHGIYNAFNRLTKMSELPPIMRTRDLDTWQSYT